MKACHGRWLQAYSNKKLIFIIKVRKRNAYGRKNPQTTDIMEMMNIHSIEANSGCLKKRGISQEISGQSTPYLAVVFSRALPRN